MISVSEAEQFVQSIQLDKKNELIDLDQSFGRILAVDILADRDQPPFHRAAMDGIAINSSETADQMEFVICGIVPAGSPQVVLGDKRACYEIMTGASLPVDADKVIRYEDIDIRDGIAYLKAPHGEMSANVHKKGSDYKANEIVLSRGQRISAPIAGILASIGKDQVLVEAALKIVIVSTGDELVDIHETPLDHQIRWSNAAALKMLLATYGQNKIETMRLADNIEESKRLLNKLIEDFDVVLITGGVSAGKYDYVPKTLEEIGVKILFHKVKQRPGKPLLLGHYQNKKIIFGLPGNPVSCLFSLRRYVIPWLLKAPTVIEVQLAKELVFNKALTLFKAVKIELREDNSYWGVPIEGNGSGDFFHLNESDGFVELNASKEVFGPGERVKFYSWGWSR